MSSIEGVVREIIQDELTYGGVQGRLNTVIEDVSQHEARLDALEGRMSITDQLTLVERLEAVEARLERHRVELDYVMGERESLPEATGAALSDDAPRYVQGDRTEDPDPYAPSEALARVRARNARAEAALRGAFGLVPHGIEIAHESVVDVCVDLIMYLPEYRRVMALDSITMHVNAGDSETP